MSSLAPRSIPIRKNRLIVLSLVVASVFSLALLVSLRFGQDNYGHHPVVYVSRFAQLRYSDRGHRPCRLVPSWRQSPRRAEHGRYRA